MGSIPEPVSVQSSPIADDGILYNVFVYGSLQSDDVVRILLKRVPPSFPAILSDYHRFNIKGRVYPAILPSENKKIIGKVLLGVTPAEMPILDAFECEYDRIITDVSLMDDSKKVQACTYVWKNRTDPDLYGEWNYEEWKRVHYVKFLKFTSEFIEKLVLPEPKREETSLHIEKLELSDPKSEKTLVFIEKLELSESKSKETSVPEPKSEKATDGLSDSQNNDIKSPHA